MKNTLYLFLILFLISCSTDNNDSIIGSEPIPTGIEQTIEATSFTDWNYYRFTDSTLQEAVFYLGDPENSLNWDIAFQRNHIKTNSGTSGPGNAGGYMDNYVTWNGTRFNDFNEDVINYTYDQDTIINTFYDISTHTFSEGSSNPILETWAMIDTLNNYTMNISNNKLIVRSANGENFYKFWVYDYYNENNQSGFVSLIFDLID